MNYPVLQSDIYCCGVEIDSKLGFSHTALIGLIVI